MHFILAYYGTLPLPTMTWNYLTSGFTEVVKTRRRFSCTLLYLDDAYKNLSPEKFTYFWQIEWDGLKSMKSETAQTLFFSDAVALSSTGSRDDKVTLPDATMATPASEYVIHLFYVSHWKEYTKAIFFYINFVSWNIFIDALGLDFYKAVYLLLQARIYCSINLVFLRALFVISFNLYFFGGFVVVTINAPREF